MRKRFDCSGLSQSVNKYFQHACNAAGKYIKAKCDSFVWHAESWKHFPQFQNNNTSWSKCKLALWSLSNNFNKKHISRPFQCFAIAIYVTKSKPGGFSASSKLLRLHLLKLKFSLLLRKNKAHMYNKAKNANKTPQKLNLFLSCEDACVKCLAWLKGAQKLIRTTIFVWLLIYAKSQFGLWITLFRPAVSFKILLIKRFSNTHMNGCLLFCKHQ